MKFTITLPKSMWAITQPPLGGDSKSFPAQHSIYPKTSFSPLHSSSNLYTVCKITLITLKTSLFLKTRYLSGERINAILTESKSTMYTTWKYFPATHTNSSTFKTKF